MKKEKYNPIVTNPKKLRQILNCSRHLSISELSEISGYAEVEITGKSRVRDLCEWRQLIQTYLRSEGYALKLIGNWFNRDHASILHSCVVIEKYSKVRDAEIMRKITKLQNGVPKTKIQQMNYSDCLVTLQNEINKRLN
tara:strand:+ start:2187 stop:2603 length:417 start_codon:yes stop_codon:yes gene_type:complete